MRSSSEKYFAYDGGEFSLTNEFTSHLTPLLNLETINKALSSTFSIIANTAIALFSITFITFFFLKQDNLFRDNANRGISEEIRGQHRPRLGFGYRPADPLLHRYTRGVGHVMLVLSCCLLLWGFPADTAFFMGFVWECLNVIPYIGPIMGAAICVVVGVVSPLAGMTFGSMVLIIVGTVLFVQAIDNFVLQPLLYSNRVKAHPLEIFLVILIAGSVAGVLGMLLAIPSYTVLRVFARILQQTSASSRTYREYLGRAAATPDYRQVFSNFIA